MPDYDQNTFPDMKSAKAAFVFWAAALSAFLLWILMPTLLHEGYRGDVIELLLIGKEWVLSSRKHPMLPAWILETIVILTNRSFAAPFIASQLCALVTLWSVWTLGRNVLSERLALVGVFVMFPYWFFTVESIKYNQNIPLIALWTLSILLVFQAFQTDKLRYWIGAGLSIGLAFHSKYSAVFLVFAILAYMTIQPEGRQHWKKMGPYLTALVAFLIFLPHLIWLYADNFSTLSYVENRPTNSTYWYHFYYPVRFAVCEMGYLIFPLSALTPMLGFVWKRKLSTEKKKRDCRIFLFYCIAVPFLLHVLIAAVMRVKLNGEYGAAFWPYFGLLCLLCFQAKTGEKNIAATWIFAGVLEIVMVITFIFQATISPYIMGDQRKFHLPMYELGANCDRIWNTYYSRPCPCISGDWKLAGSAAYTMKDRPSVHFYYSGIDDPKVLPTGTWSQDDDLNKFGAMILWRYPEKNDVLVDEIGISMPNYIRNQFPDAVPVSEVIEIPYNTIMPLPALRIGVAFIPPP